MSASRGCSDLPNTCIGFNDTALCIIPPKECWASIDRLRSLYDKAYEKWPPHINVVYPFVHPGALHRATELISLHLSNMGTSVYNGSLPVSLQAAGVFTHRHSNTVFIHDSKTDSTSQLNHIRQCIFDALGGKGDKHRMHMTIGQTDDINSAPHKFLLQKAGFIPPIQWDVVELAVLVRDTTQLHGQSSRQMKLWGTISLKDLKVYPVSIPTFLPRTLPMATRSGDAYMLHEDGCQNLPPLRFSEVTRMWEPYHFSAVDNEEDNAETFKVATYNVLAEFHHPPSHTRYPFLIKNLLEASALADVLVLQEVTDDFLCYLLNDSDIRNKYPFVSNGPPDQLDIDPLPSHLTVVVMSQWSFTWNWLSFRRLHKGSMVVQFDQLGKKDGETFFPAILSTVHLTCGLTDGAVAAKKAELQSILRYLSFTHPQNPWIIAGDFNITTSAFTIRAALEKQAISKQSADYLTSLESSLSESGLYDTWITARLENLEASHLNNSSQQLDEIFEGEQGASFDPTTNDLAAAIAGSGFNNRPQRYHRIVLKPAGLFSIQGFNMFGQHAVVEGHDAHGKAMTTYASDHWGIRCSLRMTEISRLPSSQIDASQTPARIVAQTVSESLSDVSTLRISLSTHGVYPSEADVAVRVEALELLEAILCDVENEEANAQSRHGVYFVVVPVGSYGLGTWTPSSDVDCLCIGSISPRTFFSLATQRLRKASPKNVRILRRVNALSGTMLELEILGVKMDLQYCPSALIAETWPRTMRLPATSPVFTLPVQTLAKLKPARDLYYLRQTVPDFAAFRTAFYLIKAWAKQRGIYAARFGYLGGIHIAVLLSLVCKLLSRDHGSASVPTIILTFFNHYARFDWKKQMVFDPFFHKRLRYTRTSREPMVILGFHSPSLNVASSASQPSVRTISEELQNADRFLSREGVTWEDFLSNEKNRSESGAATFLKTYKSYVKIDVQFWGISHARGSQFVGWLESRCVMLLVDLGRRLPSIHARIWPARFVATKSPNDDTDYQGCYLIGLDIFEGPDGQAPSEEEMNLAHGTLLAATQKFEGQIRNDEEYFDFKSSWMSVSIVNQSKLGDLKLDHREWGEYTIGEDESGDDEEDEEPAAEDHNDEVAPARAKKSKKREKDLAPKPVIPTGSKLRSSADVLHRLRWDSDMGGECEYLVGYRDRFLGLKERPLDQWKAEQTDEEFIPQHRIIYFKRISDGVLLWDRRSRNDTIFGSGQQDHGSI